MSGPGPYLTCDHCGAKCDHLWWGRCEACKVPAVSDARAHQARQRAEIVLSEYVGIELPDPMPPTILRADIAEDVLFLADRVAALETALRVYGNHVPPCPLWVTSGTEEPCSCGYEAALAGGVTEPNTDAEGNA